MLTLDNLVLRHKSFTLTADFALPRGARITAMGASGVGKSTLLMAIAGFHTPDSGRIMWQAQDLTPLPASQRPVAMLFQDQNLFPHLTLLQNVTLGLTQGRRASAAQVLDARQALARVGLAGMEARKPAQVSGGQAARAALARLLLQGRPIWLLDEPFAALDEVLRADMLDLTAEVAAQSGATVIMVTHQSQDTRRFAEFVVYLENGQANPPIHVAEYLASGK